MRFINAIKEERLQLIQPFEIKTWGQYADSILSGLSKKCIDDSSSYCVDREIRPIVIQALNSNGRLYALEKQFAQIQTELNQSIHLLFNSDPDVLIILYLGLCNGAGWATRIGEQRVILLGVEKILELNWDTETRLKCLIYHELGHVWHECEGVAWFKTECLRERAILQLYREGIAMVCEQILCGDESYYHQGKEWINWCKENLIEIKKEYRNRIEHEQDVRDFFGDWNDYKGHSDTGYYLGAQFIRHLMHKQSLKEIAALSYKELDEAYKRYSDL